MTKYTERSKRCMKCWQPWEGWGIVCNECRQIEKLDTIASHEARYNSPRQQVELFNPSWAVMCVLLWLFFFANYLMDWIPLKAIWFIIKAMFFVSIGMWIGMDW